MYTCKRLPAVLVSLIAIVAISLHPVGRAQDAAKSPAPVNQVENSVVKVFSTVRYPDLTHPWTKQSAHEISGSGVIIDGKRILTNAHVVLYASQIQIQANQAGDKLTARVESIAPGIDLAVLKLDDESFFDTHAALPCATAIPDVKDPVMVYGYPTGGTSLSITKGIVSRIEFVSYHYPVHGLRIQIDAAINPGNSGGPAVVGEKMIGLAFSRLGKDSENIGYIIPCEEIQLFLNGVKNGHYESKPEIYDEFQTLENPALREFLKLPNSVHGLVVSQPFSQDATYPLKTWDVITKIGNTPVDDQGKVSQGASLRLHFTYLVQKIAANGHVPLTIVRAGKELTIELPVSADRPRLLPYLSGEYPSYFICGPVVFSNASEDFVNPLAHLLPALANIENPLATRLGDQPAFPGEQLVIIPSPFFPHRLATGYSVPVARVVRTVNGIAIRNLRHLVEVLRDSKDEFIKIEFYGHDAESLVFPRKEMIAATDEILNDNGIRSQGSPDTMEVWTAKPAK